MKKLILFLIPVLISVFYIDGRLPFIERETTNEFPALVSRIDAYRDALKEGNPYPRYNTDNFNGEEYTLLNSQPLSYIAIGCLSLLTGSIQAIKIFFMLVLLIAGLSFYAYMRKKLGENTAIGAGLVYQLSPQLLLHTGLMGQVSVSLFIAIIPLSILIIKAAHSFRDRILRYIFALILLFLIDNQRFFIFLPFLYMLTMAEKRFSSNLAAIGLTAAVLLPWAVFFYANGNTAPVQTSGEMLDHYSLREISYLFNTLNVFRYDTLAYEHFEADIKYVLLIPAIVCFALPFFKTEKGRKNIFLAFILILNLALGRRGFIYRQSIPLSIIISIYSIAVIFSKLEKWQKAVYIILISIPIFPLLSKLPPLSNIRAPVNYFDIILPLFAISVTFDILATFKRKWLKYLLIGIMIIDASFFIKYFFQKEPYLYTEERMNIQKKLKDEPYFAFSPYFNDVCIKGTNVYSSIFSYLASSGYRHVFSRISAYETFEEILKFSSCKYIILHVKRSPVVYFNDSIAMHSEHFLREYPDIRGYYLNLYKREGLPEFALYEPPLVLNGQRKEDIPMMLYLLSKGRPCIPGSALEDSVIDPSEGRALKYPDEVKEIKSAEPVPVKIRFTEKWSSGLKVGIEVPFSGFVKTRFAYNKKLELSLDGKRIEKKLVSGMFCGFFADQGEHVLVFKYKDIPFDAILTVYLLILFVLTIIIFLWKKKRY